MAHAVNCRKRPNRATLETPTDDRQTLLARLAYHRGEISRHTHAMQAALESLGDLRPEKDLTPREWLGEHIACLGLSVRTANSLMGIGIETVRDLLDTPQDRLIAIPNFRQGALSECFRCLAAVGFVRRAVA